MKIAAIFIMNTIMSKNVEGMVGQELSAHQKSAGGVSIQYASDGVIEWWN